MNETYPEYEIGAEVEVVTNDDFLRGEVIGINYTCPLYMYVVQLIEPIESEFGPQTGLYVPESILVGLPDIDSLTRMETVGTYVRVTDTGAVDAKVMVAAPGDQDDWYVFVSDSVDGVNFIRLASFDTKEEAVGLATSVIEENHEAAPGENAEQYLARVTEDAN